MVVAIAAVLTNGCAGTPERAEGPIAVAPDATPPPVPALASGAGPSSPSDQSPSDQSPPSQGAPSQSPPDQGAPGQDDEAVPGLDNLPDDPRALGTALGLDGMIDLLEGSATEAGERGQDLLRELQRVKDKPDRKRLDQARERIGEWVQDGELSPAVAQAALAALDGVDTEDGGGGSGRDNGDDDDEDG